MTEDDKAMEAAKAAIDAGQPSLAGAILAADVLGMDIKDPRVMEAAVGVNTRINWAREADKRPSRPCKTGNARR